ncbi:UNVERIFIED_CONTAM: hypothetical protein PYX00_005888 [Menopon gallinae]|uniref:27 kDa hemolymph protein n=1 Tax=Menopon gallinae TaxID=328185 RepID=A0AAW2HT74_9NEOP
MQGFLAVLLLGISFKFAHSSVEKDLQGLNVGGFGNLPSNITSKLPSQEDAEKIFAEKCRKNGGETAYQNASLAKNRTIECVKNLVDFEQLQVEMEEAKPSGDLDSVFKKYCRKSPDIIGCVEKFTTDFEPCLDEEERKSKNIVLNVTTQLIEFICHKEGDRIALFIAEGGPECLNASEKGIQECFQTIYKKHIPQEDELSLSALPPLLFQAEQCEDFSKLQTCIVKELEKCKEPTPGNVIDSLFNYVRKVTPCFPKYEEAVQTRTSGAEYHSPANALIGLVINFFIVRQFL